MKQEVKNFSKKYPLWKACGFHDDFRTGMHYISFANGYAYATDSHILVRARLTDISNFDEQDLSLLDGKFIHGKFFKELLNCKGNVIITADAIIAERNECKISYPLMTGIRFPVCEKAMVGSDVTEIKKVFGIKARFLNTLSEVMGADYGIGMNWKSNHMFEVFPLVLSGDIKGYIMTIMVN